MIRTAKTLTALGLLLLTMCAAAFAQDPTPTATPSPTPEAVVTPAPTLAAELTATPAPAETAVATLTATPAGTTTPAPTATATVAPTETAAPTATAEQAPRLVSRRRQPQHAARAQATPPPDPTPTPPEQITGAALTICHGIEDDTGLHWETVTISADQQSAYYDEEFIIVPAPREGCGAITPANIDELSNQRVTVCHLEREGDYSLHTFPVGDMGGHETHKGDLIPAPDGGCPRSPYEVPTVTPTATVEPTATATEEPSPTATPTATPDDIDVFPGNLGGSAPAAETGGAATEDQLPFTGFDLWLIACAGLGMTLMGAGLRLLAAVQPPVGVTR